MYLAEDLDKRREISRQIAITNQNLHNTKLSQDETPVRNSPAVMSPTPHSLRSVRRHSDHINKLWPIEAYRMCPNLIVKSLLPKTMFDTDNDDKASNNHK